MNLIRNIFGRNQDLQNTGFQAYLNIAQTDKEKVKNEFIIHHKALPREMIDSYFEEYEELYDYAERTLIGLWISGEKEVRRVFIGIISDKYQWLDRSNLKKLYNVCSFYLR